MSRFVSPLPKSKQNFLIFRIQIATRFEIMIDHFQNVFRNTKYSSKITHSRGESKIFYSKGGEKNFYSHTSV